MNVQRDGWNPCFSKSTMMMLMMIMMMIHDDDNDCMIMLFIFCPGNDAKLIRCVLGMSVKLIHCCSRA